MRRYLVVANQTLSFDQLRQELLLRAEAEDCSFCFLVPDTAPPQYSSDWAPLVGARTKPENGEARRRLREILEVMRGAGVPAVGALADPNPVKAVEQRLAISSYDEIIVALLPHTVSSWLKLDLPSRIARAVRTPVTTITAKAS